MDLGMSKVTTQSSTVSLIKESLPILSSRDDPQSLVLLHMVQNAVNKHILRVSEGYLPRSFVICW